MDKPRFFAPVLLAAVLVALTTSPAAAQQDAGGLGVGIESPLTTGFVTGAVVYDAGSFHLDGLLGFNNVEGGADTVVFGGRGWFTVHRAAQADFHLGGGLELLYTDFDSPVDDDDDDLSIGIELGAKLRAFLTSNVAIHGVVGLAIVVGDEVADRIALTGQINGALGLTYFFN